MEDELRSAVFMRGWPFIGFGALVVVASLLQGQTGWDSLLVVAMVGFVGLCVAALLEGVRVISLSVRARRMRGHEKKVWRAPTRWDE